ncbi:MAG: DNA-binding protein [Alphaproteobacteria bacterium]
MTTHEIKSEIQAYDIESFSKAFSIGRTKIYAEILSGRLKKLKVGRRTIITKQAAEAWLNSLQSEGV